MSSPMPPAQKAAHTTFSGDYSPEEWEFDTEEPNPLALTIDKEYSLKITDPEATSLLFDFYEPSPTLVSREFVNVCAKFEVRFRTVPINITLPKRRPVKKEYSFFLPADHVALMDVNSSPPNPRLIPTPGNHWSTPLSHQLLSTRK